MKNRTQIQNRLEISPAASARLQLEWSYVEQPSPRPRFLDFPFVDRDAEEPATVNARHVELHSAAA